MNIVCIAIVSLIYCILYLNIRCTQQFHQPLCCHIVVLQNRLYRPVGHQPFSSECLRGIQLHLQHVCATCQCNMSILKMSYEIGLFQVTSIPLLPLRTTCLLVKKNSPSLNEPITVGVRKNMYRKRLSCDVVKALSQLA